MIGFSRRPRPRDPQAGVRFRPGMLAHAGSLHVLEPHGIRSIEPRDPDSARRGLLPWTFAIAGLTAAFFIGSSWSSQPQPLVTDACLATAPAPAAAPSGKDVSGPYAR